ncbi:MAG: hypothetical protein MI923_30540 [Phycisphaerales bacterium]|nr:hypothetical protein [Phycisphaerales bacterium]
MQLSGRGEALHSFSVYLLDTSDNGGYLTGPLIGSDERLVQFQAVAQNGPCRRRVGSTRRSGSRRAKLALLCLAYSRVENNVIGRWNGCRSVRRTARRTMSVAPSVRISELMPMPRH